MYSYKLHRQIDAILDKHSLDLRGNDHLYYARLLSNLPFIHSLFFEIYGNHEHGAEIFKKLIGAIALYYKNRSKKMKHKDVSKLKKRKLVSEQ